MRACCSLTPPRISTPRPAEELLIHVNTAHHRLSRIAEKTACDLRRLSDVIDLLIAVRLTDSNFR